MRRSTPEFRAPRWLLAILLGLCLVGVRAPAIAQEGPDLKRAEALVDAGRADEAWAMLAPHEAAHAGEQDFDFVLAVAALESGRPNRATFILERVVAVNPNHSAARLELGKAYFALGDMQRARIELESVRRFDAPPAARATIDRYLSAISARSEGPRLHVAGYVYGAAGHDSNVNASTAQTSVFVPLAGTSVALSPLGTRRSDRFAELGGGLELSFPADQSLTLFAGGDFRQRTHSSADAFDYRAADLRLGLRKELGKMDQLRAVLGHGEYDLDNARYRQTQSLTLDWSRQIDRRSRVSLFGQSLRFRYPPLFARANSSDMLLYGAGGAHVLDEATRTTLLASLYAADDRATDGRADGDRRLLGMRFGMQRRWSADVDWFANLGWQRSRYETRNVFFSTQRRDRQYDLSVGWSWRLDPDWTLRPQLAWTRNASNIVIDDYKRRELLITLRRDWR